MHVLNACNYCSFHEVDFDDAKVHGLTYILVYFKMICSSTVLNQIYVIFTITTNKSICHPLIYILYHDMYGIIYTRNANHDACTQFLCLVAQPHVMYSVKVHLNFQNTLEIIHEVVCLQSVSVTHIYVNLLICNINNKHVKITSQTLQHLLDDFMQTSVLSTSSTREIKRSLHVFRNMYLHLCADLCKLYCFSIFQLFYKVTILKV